MEIAYKLGIIKSGHSLEDYLIEAVENDGYETVCVWGKQGVGKSNRMLQMGFWIFHALFSKRGYKPNHEEVWGAVLDHIVFRPRDFVKRLESVPRNERIPCLLWDDIGCHYPSMKFKTDPKEYESIDQMWTVIRTKVGVVILTIPLIDRLAKNLRDNLTFEAYISPNKTEIIKRLFHLPGTENLESNFFKVIVEQPESFDIFKVPEWVWDRYWEMRLDLTDEALEVLKGEVDMEESSDYVLVKDAARYAKLNPNTIQQSISRGVFRGRKIGGLLAIHKEDLNEFLDIKGMDPYE